MLARGLLLHNVLQKSKHQETGITKKGLGTGIIKDMETQGEF